MTTTEPTLVHVNPNELVFDGNVRADTDLNPAFIASIVEHGVLVPITAVRKDDQLVVRTGHRRTRAALTAGVETVPVYVLSVAYADAKAETLDRIATQITENDQRAELAEVDRVRGIQQMLDAGISIPKAAKSLAVPQKVVKAAKTAAANPASMAVLGGGQASLEEAAAIAEFGDDENAINRLIAAAGGSRFNHVVAQIRQARATAAAAAQAAASYAEKGFTVITDRPGWRDETYVALYRLHTADGSEVTDADVKDPKHWAVRMVEDVDYVNKDTGERVDPDRIDWDVEDDDNATPEEGYVHPNTVTETTVFDPEYYCIDVAGAGLVFDDPTERQTPADPEAAAQAQAEREDKEKRERSKVLALNKLGVAAQQVRRAWVTTLLSRKTPPKGAAAFVAATLAADSYLLTTNHARPIAAELLGLQKGEDDASVTRWSIDGIHAAVTAEGLTEGRAQVLTLGLVLGALEARTGKDAWRSGGTYGYTGHDSPGEYLRFLASCGYELSDVEQAITKTKTADEVYDALES